MPQRLPDPNLTGADFGAEQTVEALRGLRGFRIDHVGPLSLWGHQGQQWKPGENFAYCVKGFGPQPWFGELPPEHDGSHTAPVLECECGIYGWYPRVPAYMENFSDVLGVAEGYGEVLVGPRGWRAEKACLLGITGHDAKDDPPAQAEIDELAGFYDVPTFPSLEALLEALPLTDPNEVLAPEQ